MFKNKLIIITLMLFMFVMPIYADDYESAKKYFQNKNYIESEAIINKLLINDKNNMGYNNLLADIYVSTNRIPGAIKIHEGRLKTKKNKIKLYIKLARLNSWFGRYNESEKYYDLAIKLLPINPNLYVEKARILGWAGKQDDALQAYDSAISKFNLKWIKNEKLGKEKLWNGEIKKAIYHFEKAFKYNANNTETLFDLAQLYSNLTQYDKATKYYKQLLAINPYNSAAVKAFEKNKMMAKASHIKVRYFSWDAKSAERMTELVYSGIDTSYSNKLTKNISYDLKLAKNSLAYPLENRIYEDSIGLGLHYNKPLFYGYGAGISYRSFSIGVNRISYYSYLWHKPTDKLNLNLSFIKENFINNYEVNKNDLNDLFIKTKVDYTVNRSIDVYGDIRLGALSDRNKYYIGGFGSKLYFLKNFINLYSDLRIEKQSFRRTASSYYAPDSYVLYSALIGFKQYLNSGGQYFGVENKYYEIIGRIIQDSNDETTRQLSFVFDLDIKQDLNIQLKYAITDSFYYKDTNMNVLLNWYPQL
jgi:tetratricopeptide (TPR) repeat protein